MCLLKTAKYVFCRIINVRDSVCIMRATTLKVKYIHAGLNPNAPKLLLDTTPLNCYRKANIDAKHRQKPEASLKSFISKGGNNG